MGGQVHREKNTKRLISLIPREKAVSKRKFGKTEKRVVT